MRFLIDSPLSPQLALGLTRLEHDAVHVQQYGMHSAPDEMILQKAQAENRIIITSDTDFGELLAASGGKEPSVVLFRRTSGRPAVEFELLLAALRFSEVQEALVKGAIVVVDPKRVRIKNLPIGAELE